MLNTYQAPFFKGHYLESPTLEGLDDFFAGIGVTIVARTSNGQPEVPVYES